MDDQLPYNAANAVRPALQSRGPASPRPRKHMGVASSDPEYLPPVNNPRAPSRDREVKVPARRSTIGHGGSAANGSAAGGARGGYIPPSSPTLQVRGRSGENGIGQPRSYISQPKRGKSIFASRQDRTRRHVEVLLAVLIIAAIALALVWFFVLR